MARGDVAFFASSEAGFAGLSREDLRSHGMPLGVSYTACEALLRAARSARARPRVFVKAHPHEPHPGRYERLASEHGATWAPWLGVYDAIAVGCVIATTSESVAWIALAAGARVLALTRRPYGPAGAVYEADGESTLPEALGGALEGRGHEAMRARGQVAVARYARECCFSHAGEWTALGVSGAGAFVERLLRDARPAGPSEPARWLERLADAGFESRTSAEAA